LPELQEQVLPEQELTVQLVQEPAPVQGEELQERKPAGLLRRKRF
jgi:hypothetical protein